MADFPGLGDDRRGDVNSDETCRSQAEMQVGFAHLEARLERRLGAQMKWMFGFWLGTLLPLAGLMIALQRWGG